MPRTCTICTHSELEAIDGALVAGVPFRRIAARFSLSEASARRHKSDHLPAVLVTGQAVREEAHALDVVKQLRDINAATLAILEDARDTHQSALALKAVDRVQKQIELQAKLLGELQDGQTVNVLVAPEWVSLRATILVALVPFPDAREAVVEALNGNAG